jgi:hypothetical protein
MNKTYIAHHGIKGQRWGIRRYQNEDGSLTPAGVRRYQKLDEKWVRKKSDKVYRKAAKESRKEMKEFLYILQKNNPNAGKRTLINMYNKKLAEVMRTKTKDITSPSGKVIEWVAKRGQVGVHMALADRGYDMSKLKNGVWADGRVAYKTKKVDMQNAKGGG